MAEFNTKQNKFGEKENPSNFLLIKQRRPTG